MSVEAARVEVTWDEFSRLIGGGGSGNLWKSISTHLLQHAVTVLADERADVILHEIAAGRQPWLVPVSR